jgi:hypothetical protein
MAGARVTARRGLRVLLALLAASAAFPGVWATIAPDSFYRSFPGHWHYVASLPPFNAHLIADAGAFYLGFALVLAWAAATLQRALVQAACAAWALFSVLHLVWHVRHLGGFGAGAAISQTVALAAVLAAPVGAVWLERRMRQGVSARRRGPA